jgi:hypothetical protein
MTFEGRDHSPYIGIRWFPDRGKWQVQIRANGRLLHLERFYDEEDAARYSDVARVFLRGGGVRLNFDGQPPRNYTKRDILAYLYTHGYISKKRLQAIVTGHTGREI